MRVEAHRLQEEGECDGVDCNQADDFDVQHALRGRGEAGGPERHDQRGRRKELVRANEVTQSVHWQHSSIH